MNNSEILDGLSGVLQEQCEDDEWMLAAATLCRMAGVHHKEKNYDDELRCLILSFYIDMSGWQRQAFVNEYTVGAMREACELLGLDKARLNDLYYETTKWVSYRPHSFTPTGCLRVLMYCVFGKSRIADRIISNLQK